VIEGDGFREAHAPTRPDMRQRTAAGKQIEWLRLAPERPDFPSNAASISGFRFTGEAAPRAVLEQF
jgi:hypothetical protein